MYIIIIIITKYTTLLAIYGISEYRIFFILKNVLF